MTGNGQSAAIESDRATVRNGSRVCKNAKIKMAVENPIALRDKFHNSVENFIDSDAEKCFEWCKFLFSNFYFAFLHNLGQKLPWDIRTA
ncbi:hypothetical protein [Methylomonas koyamae]|uniref:Uncharacterized protein n=1 Tax=Methylomonas koyamae TaxID=702114 RepID=A0AA91DHE4_9GAMM|nr:hypothetical protein [Methylomonas koyamae]OAI29805.1 hypothetical protein A1356_22820 [Methylomonas koyamae]WNB74377.1 hypothetical protein RI210_13930 [Methylomonas koyamae]